MFLSATKLRLAAVRPKWAKPFWLFNRLLWCGWLLVEVIDCDYEHNRW